MMLAALSVMNDEFNGPVPIDEINFCLRIDFKHKVKDSQLLSMLNQAMQAKNVDKVANGYLITAQGAKIADFVLQNS